MYPSLQPFARPSLVESTEIQTKITQNNREIDEIDLKIRQLLERRLRLNDENATYKSLLAPIRRLPYDVLSHIFQYYVIHHQEDPWILAHVSRTWRFTAFSTPSLWAGLHLELAPDPSFLPRNRRIDGREYCSTVKQLELGLARASSNLLDIKLASPPSFPAIVRAHIPIMIHLVSLRMDRWRSLEIDGAISHLPGLNRCPMESLEKVVLKTRDASLFKLIKETAFRLKEFTSVMVGLEPFADAVWWRTLRRLDLTIPIDTSLPPQTPILKSILSHAEALETLVLDFYQMQPEPTPLATLPNLRSLELYDIPQFLPFDCPNLVHLKISVGKRRPVASTAPLPTPPKPLVLPHLTHLTFQHPQLAALSAVVAPNLKELTISPQVRIVAPQYNDIALHAIWNTDRRDQRREVLRPKTLNLEDIHISAETIQDVLGFMEDLESLVIKWVRTDHATLLKLLSATAPTPGSSPSVSPKRPGTAEPNRRPLLCPSLQRLALYDSSTLRTNDTEAVRASFEEIVKMRRDLGTTNMKGTVCWPAGGEMKEFKI